MPGKGTVPSTAGRRAQARSLLLKLNKLVSLPHKTPLHWCSPRPGASSEPSPPKGPQPRAHATLLAISRRSWMDSCQSAGTDRGCAGKESPGGGTAGAPGTEPGALPGEPAAPAPGGSCSLPCSPHLPRGKAFSSQQALTRPPSSARSGEAAVLLTQGGLGPANPRGTQQGFLLHFGLPKPSADLEHLGPSADLGPDVA